MTWILPPFGTTLQHSTDKYSTLPSTSSLGGFHVRMLAWQANNSELNPTQEADFSFTSCDLFGNLIPNTSSSKMLQQYVLTGLAPYSGKLPKQGMMLNGVAYPLPRLERHTKEIGGGSWPTPTKQDYKKRGPNSSQQGLPETVLKHWPTPAARDWKDNGSPAEFKRNSPCLTPSAIIAGQADPTNHNSSGSHPASWPTPNTLDGNPPRPKEALEKQFAGARKGRTAPANLREYVHPECHPPVSDYKTASGMVLNPAWTSALMGYPLYWTESNHWAQILCPKKKRRST